MSCQFATHWYSIQCQILCVQGTAELTALHDGQVNPSTMQFIDFEYGSYNYRGYDFANLWNEYAGFEGDYSRYPDNKHQTKFVIKYLQQQGNSSPVRCIPERLGLSCSLAYVLTCCCVLAF